MNVVVAGLSPRDEAAFGFFLNRSMKGWSWSSTPAGRGTVLPKADLLVADLVALGLAQWSVAAEAELLRVLHGNTAVLLLPANDQTWATMNPETVRQHTLVWLQKPYGTEDMRQALEKAAAARKAAQAPPPKPAGKLTYKDQRRLAELETLIAEGPGKVAALEPSLADPGLYGRDPAGFDRLTRALAAKQAEVAAAEEEWLALEERREALESGR